MQSLVTRLLATIALSMFAWQGVAWSSPSPDDQDAETSHDAEATEHGDADSHDDSAHGDSAHGGEGHGDGEHHDPYDKAAANAGASQSSMFELRADLAIATLVVFLLLFAILYKFAWGPISAALDAREQGIADQIEEARRNNEEARNLLTEHESKLAATAEEVREILDGARRDAEGQKQAIVAEAEKAAAAEKDRAVREIAAAKNNALQELAETSVDQAVGLAGQIVGKQLSKDDHRKLIEDAVNQFPSKV